MHADFDVYWKEEYHHLHIVDLNLGNRSVTNDVEWVLEMITVKYGIVLEELEKITYTDSMGRVDQIIVNEHGEFKDFRPC